MDRLLRRNIFFNLRFL